MLAALFAFLLYLAPADAKATGESSSASAAGDIGSQAVACSDGTPVPPRR